MIWREGGSHRPRALRSVRRRPAARSSRSSPTAWTTRSSAQRIAAIRDLRKFLALVDPAGRRRSSAARCRRKVTIGDARYGEPAARSRLSREQWCRPAAGLPRRRGRIGSAWQRAASIWCGRTAVSRPAAACSARLAAPAFARVLDQLDERLAQRRDRRDACPTDRGAAIGFHAPGPGRRRPAQQLDGAGPAGDLGLGRLVQGVGAGRMVVARPGALVRTVHAPMRSSLGDIGARQGAVRAGSTRSPTACATMRPARRATTSPPITTSATISTPPGSTRAMTYSSARFARPATTLEDGAAAQDRRCCSTGSTSSPASACSRSAAAGAAWRSRRRGAARRSSA